MSPTPGGPPPARFLPPFFNEDLADFARDRTLDAAPWAAYTLGFQSQLVPLHLEIVGTAPQLGMDCFEAVMHAVYEVGLACDALVVVTPPPVAAEVRRVITALDAYNDATARGLFVQKRLERNHAHERQLVESMVVLADRAIPTPSPLSHWYTLGRALGEFRWRAQRETANALAPIRPVAEAARGVGQEHLGRLPELNELAGLVNRPEGETESGLRQAFVARIGLDGPFDDLDPWPASPFLTEKVWRIARQVAVYLQSLPAVQDGPPPPDVPRWHAAEGKLYFRGKLVREVAKQAKNVRLILDTFQSKGWPEWVDTPLTEDARKEAVDSFNKKRCNIELYRAHTATAIGWRERSVAGGRKTTFRNSPGQTGP